MRTLGKLWKRSTWPQRYFGIGCSAMLVLCGCMAALTAIFPSSPSTETPSATREILATRTILATEAATATRRPTSTTRPSATTPPTATTRPTETRPAPTQTPAPTFAVIEFRSPVPVNGDARVVIETAPGATCFLSYRTPAGTQSEADGLGATTAGADGRCAWTWQIGRGTTPGQGRVSISVGKYTQTLVIEIR